MATIQVSNLEPVGSLLFADSENFLTDLSSEELRSRGGFPGLITPSITGALVTILQEDLLLTPAVTIPIVSRA